MDDLWLPCLHGWTVHSHCRGNLGGACSELLGRARKRVFLVAIVIGGFLASHWGAPHYVAISIQTKIDLAKLGIQDFSGVAPHELFSWNALLTYRGFVSVIVGGFLIGFGTAYAGGCTSGHAISGLADFQLPSLIATIGFFAGGLAATYFILPHLF
jgi:uncharacterized protein